MAEKKNFLFGIGCEKGGSTWLHDYLAGLPDTHMSEPKEFHIFNSRFLPKEHAGSFRVRLKQFMEAIDGKPMGEAIEKGIGLDLIRVLHMYYDLDVYVDYFRRISAPDGVNLVGEITPGYSLLSIENYQEIKALLEPHFNIKIVFFMRDPIERAYSLLRMKHRNALKAGKTVNQTQEQMFIRNYGIKPCIEPSQYDQIISRVETVFDKEDIYYGFYETMFNDSEIERVCNFLGVGYKPADFDKRVNVSSKNQELSAKAVAKAMPLYKPIYDFCAERFGDALLRDIWPYYI